MAEGLNLTALAANKATVSVEYGGTSFKVTYRPSALTEKAIEVIGEKDGLQRFLEMLLVDWEIYEQRGKSQKKIPCNIEGLKSVPLAVQRAIMSALMNDDPSVEEGKI